MKWIKISDWKEYIPKRKEWIWGYWKGREVLIVYHQLSDEEIETGGLEDGIWYSIDYEKCKCITHYMPLQIPAAPLIEKIETTILL